MRFVFRVCLGALLSFSSLAEAGSFSQGIVRGVSTRSFDLSSGESPNSEILKVEADRNAQTQCSSSAPIKRVSEYEISQRYIPYSSFVSLKVQALYGCGEYEPDYSVQALSQDEDLKCDHNFQCPVGYKCQIEWKEEPYDCVKIRP